MAVVQLLVKQYAVVIYKDGNRSFATIPVEYHEPVKQYAGLNYTLEVIDNALVQGYITELEYQQTLAYKPVV